MFRVFLLLLIIKFYGHCEAGAEVQSNGIRASLSISMDDNGDFRKCWRMDRRYTRQPRFLCHECPQGTCISPLQSISM